MRSWPFAKKILAAFLALSVLMLSTVFVTVFSIRNVAREHEATVMAESEKARGAELSRLHQQRSAELRAYLISRDRRHLKDHGKTREEFSRILGVLAADLPPSDQASTVILEQIRSHETEYNRLVGRAVKEPARASWILETLLRPRRLALEKSVADLNGNLAERLQESQRSDQKMTRGTLRTIITLVAIKFLLLLGLGWLLNRVVLEEQSTLVRANEARDILQKAERRAAFLANTGRILTESPDPHAALSQVANLAVEWLANVCLIELVDAPGYLRPVALAISGIQDRELLLGSLHRDLPGGLGSLFGHDVILQSARPVLAKQAEDPRLTALGVRTYVAVPLRARNRTLGVLLLFRTDATAYDEASLQFVNEVGHQAALAIDNARLLQQAEEGLRMREELLATVSHDLKNPLTTIRMNSEMLLTRHRAAQDLAAGTMAKAIHESSNQMQRLIHDLLDLTKIESGRIKLDRRPHDADELISDLMKMLESQAKEQDIELYKDVHPGESIANCDKDRVLQVLLNLAGNSIKFTGKGGRIRIEAQATGEGIRFGVIDNGPGIPEEELPRIFDRYWQARRTGRGSAGLGLSIARGIVEAHGGRIWAESALHMGSRFFFTIPEARKNVVSEAA